MDGKFVGALATGELFVFRKSSISQRLPEFAGYTASIASNGAFPTGIASWRSNVVAIGMSNGSVVRVEIDGLNQ